MSSRLIRCIKTGEISDYRKNGQTLQLAVPIKSADVPQVQGAMLVTISCSEIMATMAEMNYQGMLILAVIVVLAVFFSYILSSVLVKPLARVTKSY